MMLRDDVLIENSKYGCIIMQNNGAMKKVNFTHVQMAETSFLPSANAGYEANTCMLSHFNSPSHYVDDLTVIVIDCLQTGHSPK